MNIMPREDLSGIQASYMQNFSFQEQSGEKAVVARLSPAVGHDYNEVDAPGL